MERLEDQDSIDQLQETYSLKQSSDGDRGTKDDNINNQDRMLKQYLRLYHQKNYFRMMILH